MGMANTLKNCAVKMIWHNLKNFLRIKKRGKKHYLSGSKTYHFLNTESITVILASQFSLFSFNFFSELKKRNACRYILKPIILHEHLWLFYPTAFKKTASSKGVTNVLQRKGKALVKTWLAPVSKNLV